MFGFNVKYTGSSGNLYTLSDGNTNILLDPGVPIKQIKRALGFNLSKYAGAICSHEHGDHAKGAGGIMGSAVDLYCGAQTAKRFGLAGHRLNIIEPLKQFSIGTFDILPFDVPHDGVDCMGFLVSGGGGKLLFLIDCSSCRYRFSCVTHVAIGVNYDKKILMNNVNNGTVDATLADRIMRSHMSLSSAVEFLEKQDLSCVGSINVLHCSSMNLDKRAAQKTLRHATGKTVII